MQAKDLIVLGSSRLLGKIYCGDIDISGTASFSGKITTNQLVISSTNDIGVNTDSSSAPLVVGNPNSSHIEIDQNEIMTKSGTTGFTSLYLNTEGGIVYLSNGSKISASDGTFTATTFSGTTGNITNVNSNTITNQTSLTNKGNIYNINGRIETDQIKSTVWDIVSTQNLGGDFFVAPTINVTEGSTFYISSISGNDITGYINDSTNINSNSFGGHTWSKDSKIKITGTLTSGTNKYILGTCDGVLKNNMNSTGGRIEFTITCTSSTKPTSTGSYTISDGTIMMYNVGGSNKVGIHMTCYGTDKYTYIDIYNGSNGTTPVARLGKLDNLGTISNLTPTGYGIMTTNGYFTGTVNANGGTIAGWTIGDGYITTNSNRTTYNNTSYTGMTMTSSGIGSRGSATSYFNLSNAGGLTAVGADIIGVIKATSGIIGNNASNKITIGTNTTNASIYSGSHSALASTNAGFYLGTDGLSIGAYDSTSGVTSCPFQVTNAGALVARSGRIGKFSITNTYLYTGSGATQAGIGGDQAFWAGSNTSNSAPFRVSYAGVLNATGATISGAITATSFSAKDPSGNVRATVTADGLLVKDTGGNTVASFGSTARIGIGSNNNHFDFNSNNIKYINANNNQIFAVTQGNTANTWRQKTVVSYAENVTATATSYTINDSNITNTEAPYTTLTIDGDTYNFSTGITCTVTNGSKVVVAISSAGVTAIQEERRYVQTTYTYAATNDTTVNASKTYYSKSGDTYTVVDVDPDATVNPKTSGWYEATLTETTKYYPCVVSVNYIIQTTDNVNLQVKGIIKIDSDGYGIDITNNKWTSSNLSDTMIRFTNASTGTNVCCGVGSGGQNHGIFSGTLNQWIIYADQNGKAYIPPSNLQVQNLTTKNITASGNIFSVKTKEYAYIKAQSNSGFIQLYASSVKDGNRGIAVRNANNSEVIPVQVDGSNNVRINATTIFRTGGRAIYNYSAQTGKKLFCFGNNSQTLRFATKTTSSTSQGISFMIGNGYYAVGSGGTIDRTNTNMYFGGGYGDDGRFVFSPPMYARTYSSNAGSVVVQSSGVLGRYNSSSIRYKHDVEYLTNEENATIDEEKKLIKRKLLKGTNNSNSDVTDILNLPVVKFKFNEGYISGEPDYDYSKPVVGLIADDVAAICPDIATYIKDKDGNKIPESYDTTKIVVRMLYIVQQMNKRIQALEEENKNLYNQLNK